jgi:site-specific recombinase XerD
MENLLKEKSMIPLEETLTVFLRDLTARNVSPHTITAYSSDLRQLLTWIHENTISTRPDQVTKADITEYLTVLAAKSQAGVTRARKLAAIKTFFAHLVELELLPTSPATHIAMPKKERKQVVYLRPDEYNRMLALAGANARDYAILQLFLQTGIRVSELVGLRIEDIDLVARTMRIMGKGQKERMIDLEKKAVGAVKSYLAARPKALSTQVFLNYQGEPISDRGIKKIVEKYRILAGISKKIGCHSLRHTFATYKAERGVSAFQLRDWLGHASMDTSLLYVHLGKTEAAKKAMEATSL